jgi:hypothetical protein
MLVCIDLKKWILAKLSNLNKEQNIWYIKKRNPNKMNATIVLDPINIKASLKLSVKELPKAKV